MLFDRKHTQRTSITSTLVRGALEAPLQGLVALSRAHRSGPIVPAPPPTRSAIISGNSGPLHAKNSTTSLSSTNRQPSPAVTNRTSVSPSTRNSSVVSSYRSPVASSRSSAASITPNSNVVSKLISPSPSVLDRRVVPSDLVQKRSHSSWSANATNPSTRRSASAAATPNRLAVPSVPDKGLYNGTEDYVHSYYFNPGYVLTKYAAQEALYLLKEHYKQHILNDKHHVPKAQSKLIIETSSLREFERVDKLVKQYMLQWNGGYLWQAFNEYHEDAPTTRWTTFIPTGM